MYCAVLIIELLFFYWGQMPNNTAIDCIPNWQLSPLQVKEMTEPNQMMSRSLVVLI